MEIVEDAQDVDNRVHIPQIAQPAQDALRVLVGAQDAQQVVMVVVGKRVWGHVHHHVLVHALVIARAHVQAIVLEDAADVQAVLDVITHVVVLVLEDVMLVVPDVTQRALEVALGVVVLVLGDVTQAAMDVVDVAQDAQADAMERVAVHVQAVLDAATHVLVLVLGDVKPDVRVAVQPALVFVQERVKEPVKVHANQPVRDVQVVLELVLALVIIPVVVHVLENALVVLLLVEQDVQAGVTQHVQVHVQVALAHVPDVLNAQDAQWHVVAAVEVNAMVIAHLDVLDVLQDAEVAVQVALAAVIRVVVLVITVAQHLVADAQDVPVVVQHALANA